MDLSWTLNYKEILYYIVFLPVNRLMHQTVYIEAPKVRKSTAKMINSNGYLKKYKRINQQWSIKKIQCYIFKIQFLIYYDSYLL